MLAGLYDDQRAAQAAAYVLHLAGGRLGILKLTKLLYLSERQSYERYGEPLTGGAPWAMKQGPVLSEIYDRTKKTENLNDTWRRLIKGRDGNDIVLDHPLEDPAEELLALSRADFGVMDSVWGEFGSLSGAQLADYTHRRCAEWTDPGSSSTKIDPDTLLRKIGMTREDAARQLEHLRQVGALKNTLDRNRTPSESL